jgi:hypothetical protein
MRTIALLLVAAVVCASATLVPVPPSPSSSLPVDFSANVTIDQGGQILHGFLYHDWTAHRVYLQVTELAQATFTIQPFGLAHTYAYTLTTSGCTCVSTPSGIIEPAFAQFPSAKKTGTCGSGGTMYTNVDFPTLQWAPNQHFCIGADGTPLSFGTPTETYTLSNYKAGRTVAFPTEPLASNQDICNQACL